METKQEYLEPSEKYTITMEIIKKKGFFVDAEFGGTITYKSIHSFYVAPNDMPHILVKQNIRDKTNPKTKTIIEKAYKIVRYADNVVIGIPIKNINVKKLQRVAFKFVNDKETKEI